MDTSSSGVVMYNGAVLELDKVMSKLDKSESNRLQVEKQMRTLQEDNGKCFCLFAIVSQRAQATNLGGVCGAHYQSLTPNPLVWILST